ncbi:hypothetical protein ACIBCB_18415 [Streptomyces uncialis]|uniref:hypothetical protein n=1 Tax=Streptomyces uncialis TaxID=1048205 RepID=UPI0037944E15
MEIEVTTTQIICDVCKRRDVPAHAYRLTVGDGRPVRRDLCTRDAEPIAAVFGPGLLEEASLTPQDGQPRSTGTEEVPADEETDPQPSPVATKKAAPRKAAAKKAAPRKAAVKKTAAKAGRRGSRSGPGGVPVMTLEEIEAMKRGAVQPEA